MAADDFEVEKLQTLISADRASQLLNCSSRTLEIDRANNRGMPFVRKGNQIKYNLDDVIKVMKKGENI